MTDFNDPMDRKKFPNRPDHPDFWKLSELVNRQDGRATEGKINPLDQAAEVVDRRSIEYMVEQRAAMFMDLLGIPEGRTGSGNRFLTPVLQALLLDGFVLGVWFERERKNP